MYLDLRFVLPSTSTATTNTSGLQIPAPQHLYSHDQHIQILNSTSDVFIPTTSIETWRSALWCLLRRNLHIPTWSSPLVHPLRYNQCINRAKILVISTCSQPSLCNSVLACRLADASQGVQHACSSTALIWVCIRVRKLGLEG